MPSWQVGPLDTHGDTHRNTHRDIHRTPTGTPTGMPTETPTGITLSWMPTAEDPCCGFCVWLVQGEMDRV
jgi:hypothetical protein